MKKYPRIHPPRDHAAKAIKDHGHNFARKLRAVPERRVREKANGALILVPATPAMIPVKKGIKPPPTRNIRMDSKIGSCRHSSVE